MSIKEACTLRSSFRKAASAISDNSKTLSAKVITPLNSKKKENDNNNGKQYSNTNDKVSTSMQSIQQDKPSIIQTIHNVDQSFLNTIDSFTALCNNIQKLTTPTNNLEEKINSDDKDLLSSLLQCKQTLLNQAKD